MTKRILIMIVVGLLGLASSQERQPLERKAASVVIEALEGLPYPYIARLSGYSGQVVVTATLDHDGLVVNAVADGQPVLTADTLTNIYAWRFRPNPENRVVIVYDFLMRHDCNVGEIQNRAPSRFHFQAPNHVTIMACPFPM